MIACSRISRFVFPLSFAIVFFVFVAPTFARDFAVRVLPVTFFDGTEADVYAPAIPRGLKRKLEDAFPVVVFLQGALIDKAEYSEFGKVVARQGYTVVIPNRYRLVPAPPPAPEGTLIGGFFADVDAVTEAIDVMIAEDADSRSPLYRIVNTSRAAVVGHSFGGAAAIDAAAGVCAFPFCTDCVPPACIEQAFPRPDALKAGVVYGGSRLSFAGEPLDRDTTGVGVALIQGTKDGIAAPDKADATLPALEYPHALINIPGATHYALCNTEQPPFPATDEPNESDLDQQEAIEQVANWTVQWLDMILAQD